MPSQARTTLPYAQDWLQECGEERSAAGLDRLRRKAGVPGPSKSTIEDVVYRDGLVKFVTAHQIISIFDCIKPGVASISRACSFDYAITNLSAAVSKSLENRLDNERGIIEDIASASGFDTKLIVSLMRKKVLLPKLACEEIANTASNILRMDRANLVVGPIALNRGGYAPPTDDDHRIILLNKIFPDRSRNSA